jgi:hypothetical protein
MKKTIIFLTSFLLIILGGRYLRNNNRNIEIKSDDKDTSTISIEDGCTRENRLDNEPEYDRALSLINQRISEHEEWCDKYCESEEYEDKLRHHHFPANLTNCIKIIEEDIGEEAEGYFIFHSDDIKPNYFPIVVDNSYNFSDDILTSFLITHEITHVQQYLDELRGKQPLTCRDKEVDAFISQIDFYVLLNNEENKSVYLKMNEEANKKHPQIEILSSMIDINRSSTCSFLDDECRDKNLRNGLFQIISQDEGYRHQCDF